jgi:hypothetical protein
MAMLFNESALKDVSGVVLDTEMNLASRRKARILEEI